MADPGWYEDPTDNSILRWWDGGQWTSEVSPNPTAAPQPQDGFPQGGFPQGGFPQGDMTQGGMTQGGMDPRFGQQQNQTQVAPWDQPATDSGFNFQQNPNTEQYTQQTTQYPAQDANVGQQDAYSPPPWPPQEEGFTSPQMGAPWETPAGTSAAGADPYAPQASPWETGPSTQQSMLAGYATQDEQNTFGRSLYETPDQIPDNDFFDDESDDGSGGGMSGLLSGPKRIVVIGGVVLLGLVLLMGVRSVLFGGGGGDETAGGGQQEQGASEGGGGVTPPDQSSESGVPLVQIPSWSKWPSITLGYVIEYPTAPSLNSQSDRQVFTAQKDGAQYQLTVRNIDTQTVAALSGQERLELVRRLILEQNPDASAEQIQNFAETDLGGLPARQVEWEKADGAKVVARFTFTQNRIYLLTGIGPDTEKFLNSFGWFRDPPTL